MSIARFISPREHLNHAVPYNLPRLSPVRQTPLVPAVINRLNISPLVETDLVAPNGDQFPFGLAFVPPDFVEGGVLQPFDAVVGFLSNADGLDLFSSSTLLRVTPTGESELFYQGPPDQGLITSPVVLRNGLVIAGATPLTVDALGNPVASRGSLIVIDAFGNQIGELNSPLFNGVWNVALGVDAGSRAVLFVSNLNDGTIVRLDLSQTSSPLFPLWIERATVIASGFGFDPDPFFAQSANGMSYDARRDTLYYTSGLDDAVYAVPNALHRTRSNGPGRLVHQSRIRLSGASSVQVLPGGNLLVSTGYDPEGDPNANFRLVEMTPQGRLIAQFTINNVVNSAGAVAVLNTNQGLLIGAVDSAFSSLAVWTLPNNGRLAHGDRPHNPPHHDHH